MYTQHNLEKLLKECYDEIEQAFKETYCANEFNFKKDCITIQSGHTNGNKLGTCYYRNVTYRYSEYTGRRIGYNIGNFDIVIYDHKGRDIKGIKETIIHELIHTLKDCDNHKSEFKRKCFYIQSHLGYNCLSGQHNDTQSIEYKVENFKHFLVCPHCNKIVGKSNRKTKPYQYPNHYHCGACKTHIKYYDNTEIKQIFKVGV